MGIYEEEFRVSLLEIEKFIKANNVQEISNPILFQNNLPTSDGLLSNEIFGITSATRSQTFGYINLVGHFLQPLVYKIWCKIDSAITNIVHGTKRYKISSKGEFIEDEDGDTGLEFIYKNLNKIKFKAGTSSVRRDRNLQFLEENRDNLFITKLLVIPPMYRDVKSDARKLSVGDINRLYIQIIIASKALKEGKQYGFALGEATYGRVQDLILEVYNWFGAGTDSNPGGGIPSKYGILKQANMKKTTDYGTRLVLTSPDLNVESMEDMQVDIDYSLLPMASAAANFFPFVIFHMRRLFENMFTGNITIPSDDGKSEKIGEWRNAFSDDKLKEELDRFIHGYSDRFRPVLIPLEDGKYEKINFNTVFLKNNDDNLNRPVTWCDIIFIAASEAVKDRMILITRYPMDSYFNQFPTKVRLSSTIETEPMTILGVFYKNYPKIRKEDIGSNTASRFIDSLNISNCYLSSIGGDYDGDMTTIKGAFTEEANEELKAQLNSNKHFIGLNCKPVLDCTKEAIQSVFALTLTFDSNALTEAKF